MRFGFVTCVLLGRACMDAIYGVGGSLDLVMTLQDDLAAKKAGRVSVDAFCADHGIDLVKIRNINDSSAIQSVREHDLDWLFIIGWSQIARTPLLSAPRRGVIGMHPTLLPKGRGRAAIPWAILKGLSETGVTMFKLDEGVDTGPIVAQETIPLSAGETASTLYEKVVCAHSDLIRSTWGVLVDNLIVLRPQDSAVASEWPGRRPEDGMISPQMKTVDAERLIRATTHPYPGAFWKEGAGILRIWIGVIGTEHEEPPDGARRIRLSDGVIDALDYELEC